MSRCLVWPLNTAKMALCFSLACSPPMQVDAVITALLAGDDGRVEELLSFYTASSASEESLRAAADKGRLHDLVNTYSSEVRQRKKKNQETLANLVCLLFL